MIDGEPVRAMEVRAVITEPMAGARVSGPVVIVAGYAWTGCGLVEGVELSDDRGATWLEADLGAAASPTHGEPGSGSGALAIAAAPSSWRVLVTRRAASNRCDSAGTGLASATTPPPPWV